jgi:hypothetical protein
MYGLKPVPFKVLPEQGIDEGGGGEFQEVGHFFAYAYEADGEV